MRTLTHQVTNRAPPIMHVLLGHLAAITLLLVPMLAFGAAPLPPRYVEGELLVKFKGGPRGEAAAQAQQAFQHKVKRHFDPIGWQHIQLPPGQTVAEALDRYRRHPGVLAVEPNYLRHFVPMCTGAGVIPNDPRFTEQWALTNICATNAWATTTGSSNVVVAVIDSGIRYNHEDLAANMWRNPGESGDGKENNGRDDDLNGYVDDVYGIDVVSHDGDPKDQSDLAGNPHGTLMAGPIGAVGNNGRGIAGVNWSVRLMAIRFLINSQSSNYVDAVGLVEACLYVLDMKSRGVNVRVTCNAWGPGPPYYTNTPSAVERCALETLGNAGVLNVFAVPPQPLNLDVTPHVFPHCYHLPSMINVTATDKTNGFGSDSWGVTNVDLAAPGASILTTYGFNTNTTDYVSNFSGTSFSCAYVAGAAALLASAYPFATADQIKTALLENVDEVDSLTNRVASKGRLNVAKAMQHPALSSNAPPFIVTPPQSHTVGLGCPATFCVIATGAQPMNYHWQFKRWSGQRRGRLRRGAQPVNFQWRSNGRQLTNTSEGTLTLAAITARDAGAYAVVLSNAFGMATSAVATLTVADCPVILVQPRGRVALEGTDVTLTVVAAGACPLAFQWQRSGEDIRGATNSSLGLTDVRPSDSGDYQVLASNRCGSVLSDVATLNVLGWPSIIEQPQNQTVAEGTDVTLRVIVTNTATLPVGFNWRQNSSGRGWVTNGFTNVMNLPSIRTNSAGKWTVVITNAAARLVSSSTAYVTVVKVPTDQMVGAGGTAIFTVDGVGPGPLSYQWQHNGENLTDTTNSTLVLSNVQPADAGEYAVVVTNAAREPTSFPAHLTVLVPLSSRTVLAGSDMNFAALASATALSRYQWQFDGTNLAKQAAPFATYSIVAVPPKNQTVKAGDTVTFTAPESNSPSIHYHWQHDGENLTDATNSTLVLSNVQPTDAGTYTVVVTNAGGQGRPFSAYLTVVVPPASQTLFSGSHVTFTVDAYGPAPIRYQWQFNGTNLTDGGSITGATTAHLTISNLRLPDAGLYTVVVTDAAGESASFSARLQFEPTVRLVYCEDSPSGWCLQICWPDGGSACGVKWTDDVTKPIIFWQDLQPCEPWPCPISVAQGHKCVRIPVIPDTMRFFILRCVP